MRNGGARLIVVAVAVLVGIVILFKLGDTTPVVAVPDGNGGGKTTAPATTSASPTSSTPVVPTGGDGGVTPVQDGVAVAIYNATTTDGLAGACGEDLKKEGYVIVKEDNFPQAVSTTIYYRDGAQGKADAQLLAQTSIPEAKGNIKKLPSGLPSDTPIPADAELVIVLGNDYAANHPITG
jgi:hypothetical protein